MSTLPDRVVGCYWFHASALRLNTLHTGYNVVWIAFADPTGALDGSAYFDANAYPAKATFKSDMAALRARTSPPKIILSSFGGPSNRQVVNSNATADKFAADIIAICQDYGFDGFDWDLEYWPDITAAALSRATSTIRQTMGPNFIITVASHLGPSATDFPSNNNGRIYADFVRTSKADIDAVFPQYYNRDNRVLQTSYLSTEVQAWKDCGLREDQIGLLFMFQSPIAVSDTQLITHAYANTAWDTLTTSYPDLRGMGTWSMALDQANSNAFATSVGPNILNNGPLQGGSGNITATVYGTPINATQTQRAKQIMQTCYDRTSLATTALKRRAAVMSVACAMVEGLILIHANPAVPNSLLVPYDTTSQSATSIGLFHQEVGPNRQYDNSLASCQTVMDPTSGTNLFLDRLLAVPSWNVGGDEEAGNNIQAAQQSGAGADEAYEARMPEAEIIVAAIGFPPTAPPPTTPPTTNPIPILDNFNVAPTAPPGSIGVVDDFNVASVEILPPLGVTGLSATPLNGGAQLSWVLPAETPGRSPITGLILTATTSTGVVLTWTLPGDITTGEFAGLSNANAYTFTLTPQSAVGPGAPVTVSATPSSSSPTPVDPILPDPSLPLPPTVLAALAGNQGAYITWAPHASTQANQVAGYWTINLVPTDDTVAPVSSTVIGTARGQTLTGLVNGAVYTVTVLAGNLLGKTPSSNTLTVTPTSPGATLPAALPEYDPDGPPPPTDPEDPGPPPHIPVPAPSIIAFYPVNVNSSKGYFAPDNWAGVQS